MIEAELFRGGGVSISTTAKSLGVSVCQEIAADSAVQRA